jgi:hypothetical protein
MERTKDLASTNVSALELKGRSLLRNMDMCCSCSLSKNDWPTDLCSSGEKLFLYAGDGCYVVADTSYD